MAGVVGVEALTRDDSGALIDPSTQLDWDDWVAAGRTRHYCEDDPLLDWLDLFGRTAGFVPDDDLDGYDPRTDLRLFLLERGKVFEDRVMELIRACAPSERVASGWQDARDPAKARRTFDAMVEGIPVIEQAVLRNPQDRTYGVADLLVRADVLNEIVPDVLSLEEVAPLAPGLGLGRRHYRVVDIKLTTLDLLTDGHAGSSLRPYMAQVWIYNEALGRIQGLTAPASYLLGRGWHQGARLRGAGCLERLARVDHEPAPTRRSGPSPPELARGGVGWLRRLRREGAGWRVLPMPSTSELYPHARSSQDMPWHTAKRQIARELRELTLLPGMNPERRRAAHRRGIRSWADSLANATILGVPDRYATQCDAVRAANLTDAPPTVVPERFVHADPAWRTAARLEFFVDFETVSNLADDFSSLPRAGGQPLIFQIGCGHLEDGRWQFRQWTVDRLREANEAVCIGAWVDHMASVLGGRELTWSDCRVVHWSAAEWVNLSTAYNSARARHPGADWPALPWWDLLNEVVRVEPLTIGGAFDFGLKSIAKAMHFAGFIGTSWDEGPTDGLGAMVGAWWCDGEAARLAVPMAEIDLMGEIGRYNEVDCQVMAEILGWLRTNR